MKASRNVGVYFGEKILEMKKLGDRKFKTSVLDTDVQVWSSFRYARCTRSVSIVPPAYYAHLAAFRACFYMEPETSGGESMVSGSPGARGGMGVERSTLLQNSPIFQKYH
ncbi:hypothetical protein POM88_030568 [Heracleum sosnowskyi]|uniref:Uncharacterized protein n=1 Tax=Heracleum sosnowskyi TaxID=360622 RepID=A0AAD8HW58_9APIA|nr:hypothetical protein POM88_030568 [Heracleum sosnowskyi]